MEMEAIGSVPWATTLAGIARRGIAAELVLEAPGDKRYRIAFENGAIVGASSPLTNDSAVRIANVNHFVPRAMAPELAKKVAATPGCDELDVIVETASLTAEQTANLWRLVITQRAARTFAIDEGKFAIVDEATSKRIDGVSVDVGVAIYQGSRLNLSEDRLAAHLRKAGTYFVMRPDADLTRFQLDDEVQPLIDALTRGASLPELEAKHRDIDPRTLRALLSTLVACEQCEAFFEAAITPPVLPPDEVPITFKKPVDGGSYSDRGSGKDVVAEPITYRVKPPSVPPLTARAPTTPPPLVSRTSTADASAGDEAFQRGLKALRGERLDEAISELEDAIAKAPQNIDYLTYLAWAKFCAADDKHAVLDKTRRACMYGIQHSPQPILGWFFLGRVERIVGHERDALRHFQEVLAIDPKHAEAAAEVRVLQSRLGTR